MEASGFRCRQEVNDLINRCRKKKLDPKKVLRGTVYVLDEYVGEKEIRAKLILSPGAAIRQHLHDFDNEKYITSSIVDGKIKIISETCLIGQWHELVNLSEDGWLVVQSIKWW